MRLGSPSFSLELAQHIRLCGRDKDAIDHAKMILGVSEAPAQDGAASATMSGATAAKDPHKLAFGVATPPALFGSTDIRERKKEGESNVYAHGAACL